MFAFNLNPKISYLHVIEMLIASSSLVLVSFLVFCLGGLVLTIASIDGHVLLCLGPHLNFLFRHQFSKVVFEDLKCFVIPFAELA